MRTGLILAGGLVLLALFVLAGRFVGGGAPAVMGRAALWFLPAWFLVAALNMYMGVARAGYSVTEELPIFALIFAVPGAAALAVWWRTLPG